MMKKIITIISICLFCAFVYAQENQSQSENESNNQNEVQNQKEFQNHVLTAIGFSALQVEEKDFVLSPSVNAQYMRIKNQGVEAKGPDAIVIGGGYSLDHFTKGLGPEEADNFHGINLMGNVVAGKNSFIAMLASSGEIPFSSIKTLTAGLMYTRNMVNTDNVSFQLGCGIIAGDFGLKIKDFNIYVIPLPLFSFNYHNDIFSAGISVMGLPSLSLTLFPNSLVRFKGNCGIAGFKSVRDLTFDCALVCYPLLNTKAKELISLSAGIMNTVKSSTLKDKTKYDFQYYSVYGEINATFISLRAGYNFDGITRVADEVTGDMYKGLFASVQAMFMF